MAIIEFLLVVLTATLEAKGLHAATFLDEGMQTEFTVTFAVEEIGTSTWVPYKKFIESLREEPKLISKYSHGRPVLHPEIKPPTNDRWFHIILKNTTKTGPIAQVTLRIRLSNLYLDGYQMEDSRWFEFGVDNDPESVRLIPNSIFLGFKEGYGQIEVAAAQRRENIKLGLYQLRDAIEDLASSEVRQARAKALLVVIQMMSESIRFRYISDRLATKFQAATAETPSKKMLALENAWRDISRELLHIDADPTHRFVGPGGDTGITTAEQAVEAIGMLKLYEFSKITGEMVDTFDAAEEEEGGESSLIHEGQPVAEGIVME